MIGPAKDKRSPVGRMFAVQIVQAKADCKLH
jgi:hypothetical protein